MHTVMGNLVSSAHESRYAYMFNRFLASYDMHTHDNGGDLDNASFCAVVSVG